MFMNVMFTAMSASLAKGAAPPVYTKHNCGGLPPTMTSDLQQGPQPSSHSSGSSGVPQNGVNFSLNGTRQAFESDPRVANVQNQVRKPLNFVFQHYLLSSLILYMNKL